MFPSSFETIFSSSLRVFNSGLPDSSVTSLALISCLRAICVSFFLSIPTKDFVLSSGEFLDSFFIFLTTDFVKSSPDTFLNSSINFIFCCGGNRAAISAALSINRFLALISPFGSRRTLLSSERLFVSAVSKSSIFELTSARTLFSRAACRSVIPSRETLLSDAFSLVHFVKVSSPFFNTPLLSSICVISLRRLRYFACCCSASVKSVFVSDNSEGERFSSFKRSFNLIIFFFFFKIKSFISS